MLGTSKCPFAALADPNELSGLFETAAWSGSQNWKKVRSITRREDFTPWAYRSRAPTYSRSLSCRSPSSPSHGPGVISPGPREHLGWFLTAGTLGNITWSGWCRLAAGNINSRIGIRFFLLWSVEQPRSMPPTTSCMEAVTKISSDPPFPVDCLDWTTHKKYAATNPRRRKKRRVPGGSKRVVSGR